MTSHFKNGFACLALTATAFACGYTNPGGGTQTLEVNALLHYSAATDTTAAPMTQVQITISKNGAAVPNPVVTLVDADTNQTFTVAATSDPNTLTTQLPGYHRRMSLNVVSGNDNLQAHLEGPGQFTLSTPLQGQDVQQSGGLGVQWQTVDGVRADQVRVVLTPANVANVVSDSGSYAYGASQLTLGSRTVSVIRTNSVVPAGGTGTSLFQIDYEVDVSFEVGG